MPQPKTIKIQTVSPVFMSLEELAREFAEKNHLKITRVLPYNFSQHLPDAIGKDFSSGLSLTLTKGAVLLSTSNDRREYYETAPQIAGPMKIFERRYILTGEVRAKEIFLETSVSYSQRMRRGIQEGHLLEYELIGEPEKVITRIDNNPDYWFITDPKPVAA